MQSGFKFSHSVTAYQLNRTGDWYLNIDEGQYTAMIFANLKRAFGTVDHKILLKELGKYGVIGHENA